MKLVTYSLMIVLQKRFSIKNCMVNYLWYSSQSVEGQMELLRQAIKRYRDAQNHFALKVS